jgi:hypothetical protein
MSVTEGAVLRRRIVLARKPPNAVAHTAFTMWFRCRKPLRGSYSQLLDDEGDLMVLGKEECGDRLSKFIQNYFGHYIRDIKSNVPKLWGPLYYIPAERVACVVGIVNAIVSVILLFGTIVSPYHIQATHVEIRLGVVGLFTSIFASFICLSTNAKRGEILCETAA